MVAPYTVPEDVHLGDGARLLTSASSEPLLSCFFRCPFHFTGDVHSPTLPELQVADFEPRPAVPADRAGHRYVRTF